MFASVILTNQSVFDDSCSCLFVQSGCRLSIFRSAPSCVDFLKVLLDPQQLLENGVFFDLNTMDLEIRENQGLKRVDEEDVQFRTVQERELSAGGCERASEYRLQMFL